MKIELHGMVKKATGEWDGLVFKKVFGKTVAVTKPSTSSEPTAGQLAQREHFKQAVMYARSALADAVLGPVYAAAAFAKQTPVFGLIVADYLNHPSIDEVDTLQYIGQVGGIIHVATSDDFGVVSVDISICDTRDGTIIERGQAVESIPGSGHWIYIATNQAPAGIEAGFQIIAKDRPGGQAVHHSSKQI